MRTLGICFGASSMQCVELQVDPEVKSVLRVERVEHGGNPKRTFLDYLGLLDLYDIDRIAVTGRGFRHAVPLSSISESEAVECALAEEACDGKWPDLVVSCGGETQLVYRIGSDGSIVSVHSGNKCAAGTGEFFLQQIRRMGLSIDEAVAAASKGEAYRIAGRCSVFCKSDCTHALNKGVPVRDIAAGLCRMMADKVDELIKDMPSRSIMIIGGGSLNTAVVDLLRLRHDRVIVPDCGLVFEAYGAALWAAGNRCVRHPVAPAELVVELRSGVSVHPPLTGAVKLVEFRDAVNAEPREGDVCVLGLDVGSTTTKAVLLRTTDKRVLADVYLRTNGDPLRASRECYADVSRRIRGIPVKVTGIGVTGSGRQIAGLHALTDNVINEIVAHATAAAFFDDEVDTIFEIGGQDAKYTCLTDGVPSDYAMNEACSAGTGSFLEESAYESLGVPTEEIAELALLAERPPDFTDQCAAFISSDIKRATQDGYSREDILAGLVYSICQNFINRVKGARPTGRKIMMQGGVCYNRAVPIAMAAIMRTRIVVPADPGLAGALGVALETLRRFDLGLSAPGYFDLAELASREAVREGTFVCNGGREKCDRKCEVVRIRIGDRVYPFGGACDRYYNARVRKEVNAEDFDLVAVRQELMFEVYGAGSRGVADETGHEPRTVGLNLSLLTQSLYPLFANFFCRIGFGVVLPDSVSSEGIARAEASFCLPVEIAHGGFYSLLEQKCDYIFVPQVMQVPVPNVPTYSRLCPFIQGEPYYLTTTFRQEIEESGAVLLTPVLRMGHGYEEAVDVFVAMAADLGVDEKSARNAYQFACAKQQAFEKELLRHGRKALHYLDRNPGHVGVALLGRSYNAFAREANMGLPHKIASRGHLTIPIDMLPVDKYSVDPKMFWASGQRIMKAAQLIREKTNLFGVYVTNFSCGPDSFLIQYFRDCMERKPSLTIELDQHTADAGVDTRIEAALEIMSRHLTTGGTRATGPVDYAPARIETSGYVRTSEGGRLPFTDPRVELLIPSMGRWASEAVAGIMRSAGIRARALPIVDKEVFSLGRRNTLGKECLPFMVTSGAFLKYLESRDDETRVTLLAMATGGGPCRLGQYATALGQIIRKKKIRNAAMLTITDENGYGGLGTRLLLRAYMGILLSDVFGDIRSMLQVTARDPDDACEQLDRAWDDCVAYFEGRLSVRLFTLLSLTSGRLRRIPLRRDPRTVPVVSLVGEIFVRRDEFSRRNIVEYLQERGFMVRVAALAEYVHYGNYVVNSGLGENEFSVKERMKMRLATWVQEWLERRVKVLLAGSGLYRFETTDVAKTIHGVKHIMNENFRGEAILTIGLAMREILEESCGVVSIGPFGCMYSRIAEAILKKEMNVAGKARIAGGERSMPRLGGVEELPFLALEADGNPYPQLVEAQLESFVLHAHRLHEKLMQSRGRPHVRDSEVVADIMRKQ